MTRPSLPVARVTAVGAYLLSIVVISGGCQDPAPQTPEVDRVGVRTSGEAGERLSAEGCRDGSCIIRLDTVARITDRDGRIPELAFFERDSAGQIWVTGYTRDHMLRVDPTTGEFAAVGQAGSGPGEFRRVGIPLMAPGDSLHLYDMSLLRSTVIGPDFEVARIYSLSYPPTLRLNDGRFLSAGFIGTREAAGYPLHLLAEGVSEIEYSFGTDQPRMDPAERHLLTRVVGHGADGTFWAAAPGRFVFERWDPNTRELRSTLTPSIPSWLDGLGDPRGAGDRIERPKPTIHRIWEDGDAVLWVLASIPDPQWAPMHGELKPWLDPEDYAEVYDWVLHAIDPASGILVAWIQFDRRVNIQPPHSVLVHGGEYHADTLVFHLTVPRLAR